LTFLKTYNKIHHCPGRATQKVENLEFLIENAIKLLAEYLFDFEKGVCLIQCGQNAKWNFFSSNA